MAEPARLLPMPSAPSGRSLPGLSLVKAPPDSQIGTPIRVLLVVVLVGALLFAVKTFVLGGGESVPLDAASLSVVHVPKTPPAVPAAAPAVKAAPAAAKAAPKKAAAGTTGAQAVKLAVDPAAAVAQAEQTAAAATARITAPNATATAVDPLAPATPQAATTAPADAAAAPGGAVLPKPIASALRKHAVVVVGLYAPDSATAEMAWREAKAGADSSGAGFVAVDVHQEALAAPLTALLGVMSDPSLIVFQRPGKVFVRIDGFVDRETVVQAVANAKLAQ